MKKIFIVIFAIFISMAGTVSTARADCVMGTPNCDPCPAGDSACMANAQTFTDTYGTLNTDITNTSISPAGGTTNGSGSGFVALAPIPGLTQGVTANEAGLANFFNNLYKYLIGLAAAIAIVMIIWEGIRIAMNQDNVSAITDSKGKIYNAIFGLILVLSPVLVFSIINPSILNLSINFTKLDTASGFPGSGSAGTSGTGTQASSPTAGSCPTGCTCTGTLLKKAVCSTQQAAQDYAIACSGKVSSSLLSSNYTGLCETTSGSVTGPYTFIDTSQATGLIGWFNTLTGYSYYQPLASNPTNSNNGTQVLQFATTCKADGGTICMSAIKTAVPIALCTYGAGTTASVSYCWAINLYCTDGVTGTGGCSSNPEFRIVN